MKNECQIFLCYRQIDGRNAAEWLYESVNGKDIYLEGHGSLTASSTLTVYFDQATPAVADWHDVHQPALEEARAMILICTPGACVKQENEDWVYKELEWWIYHRKVAPILIDTTGEGDRWVPEPVKARWPNAQIIEVSNRNLGGLSEKENAIMQNRVKLRILSGIQQSEHRVTHEDLQQKRRLIRYLTALTTLLLVAIAIGLWQRASLNNRQKEIVRYADAQRLDVYNNEALDSLWPADDRKIRSITEWIAKTEVLLGRLNQHRRALQQLQAQLNSNTTTDASVNSFEVQRQYKLLQGLVTGLENLASSEALGSLAEMRTRLEFAQSVRRKTLEESSDAWEEAILSIRRSSMYGGLEISPQLGLIPIGADAQTGLWEFWHVQTGKQPTRNQRGELEVSEVTGLVFVLIPGGAFWMGAQSSDPAARNFDISAREHESPVHRVELDAFFFSKYEMTQGQWLRVVKKNPSLYAAGSSLEGGGFTLLHPVEQVSWHDANDLLRKLDLVLPTEAQWEYAARAGTESPWWTGEDPLSLEGVANIADQSAHRIQKTWAAIRDWPTLDDGYPLHAPVGSYRPNPWGLHDIYGNVWEWCLETKGSYTSSVAVGAGLRQVIDGKLKIRRGGAYTYSKAELRSAHRGMANPDYRTLTTGLRPVRSIK